MKHVAALLAAVLFAALPAQAQQYPNKPIRIPGIYGGIR